MARKNQALKYAAAPNDKGTLNVALSLNPSFALTNVVGTGSFSLHL
jgi:hypothetical protein